MRIVPFARHWMSPLGSLHSIGSLKMLTAVEPDSNQFHLSVRLRRR
jgi:hypothetical protein